jgi:hypothetical protein
MRGNTRHFHFSSIGAYPQPQISISDLTAEPFGQDNSPVTVQ